MKINTKIHLRTKNWELHGSVCFIFTRLTPLHNMTLQLRTKIYLNLIKHAFDPSMRILARVRGHPRLHSKILFQKTRRNKIYDIPALSFQQASPFETNYYEIPPYLQPNKVSQVS